MTTTTYTQARNNFKAFCDMAADDAEVVVITRERGENVVLLSESEWESIQETLAILGDDDSRTRLECSLKEAREGDVTAFSSVAALRRGIEDSIRDAGAHA